nr:S24 family peptidase [Snodgrassella alvi]
MKTIEKTRVENLMILRDLYGDIDKLASILSLPPATIEHWINTNSEYDNCYKMTSQDAHRIELILKLERGWLDQGFKSQGYTLYNTIQSISNKKTVLIQVDFNNKPIDFIPMVGDAMSPSFNHGDVLLLDTSVNRYENEGVYCFISQTNNLMIKRMQKLMSGDIRISCDNQAYLNSEIVPKEAIKDIRICGKVVATWSLKPI